MAFHSAQLAGAEGFYLFPFGHLVGDEGLEEETSVCQLIAKRNAFGGSSRGFDDKLCVADHLPPCVNGKVYIELKEAADEFFARGIYLHTLGKALEEMRQEDEEQGVLQILKGWHNGNAAILIVDNTNHGKQDIVAHMLATVRLPCEQPPVLVGAASNEGVKTHRKCLRFLNNAFYFSIFLTGQLKHICNVFTHFGDNFIICHSRDNHDFM